MGEQRVPDREDAWTRVERRAAAGRGWPGGPALADPASWDAVAVRGILAIVGYCLSSDPRVFRGFPASRRG